MDRFFRYLLLIFLIVPLLVLPHRTFAADPEIPAALLNLQRTYDISFLWFDRLAEGRFELRRDPADHRYHALLEAKTLGAAAWLTGDRVQRYETVMEWGPDNRLRPVGHRSSVQKKKGGKEVSQIKEYTFRSGAVEVRRIKDGAIRTSETIPLKSKVQPEDFLTAFVNFVIQADGPFEAGKRIEIASFSHDGETRIGVEVLRPEDWPKSGFFTPGSGTLLRVYLAPDILDTGGGAVYALLDSQARPERVIVENVLGMGDVRGVRRTP